MSLSKLHGGSKTVVSSSSTSTACAACKYQRKKCSKNCLLAPYFPQERQKQFLNAHKLFGVSNITKMLKDVEESQRDVAMQNLIYHANARALDPVGGLYRVIYDLKYKIECCQAEYNLVHQQLAMYRSLDQQQQQIQRQMQMQKQRQDLPLGIFSYGDLLEQGEGQGYANVNAYYHHHQNVPQIHEMHQQQQLQMPLNYETFLEMPDQTSKAVKLEQERISDPEQNSKLFSQMKLEQEGVSDPEQNNNLFSQMLMSS